MMDFFCLDARISRTRLIAGILLALALAWIGILLLRRGEPGIAIVFGLVGGATVAKLLTEAVRRRHDMGAGGTPAILLFVGGAIVVVAATIYALGTGATVVLYTTLLVLALGWAALLLRPGEAEANGYGPAPANPLSPAFGRSRGATGLLVAAALTIAGGAAGYAGARWVEALRSHHAAVEQATRAFPDGNSAAPDDLETQYRRQNTR